MIRVEGTLHHPVFGEALTRAPETRLEWERADVNDSGRLRVLVWAEGGDPGRFERGLDDDPTVSMPTRTVDMDDCRLYQTELTEEGMETAVYPLVSDQGALIRSLVGTHEGWEFDLRFPEKAAVDRFFEFCTARDVEYVVDQMGDCRERNESVELTPSQRETLRVALETGYLEIPRESTLAEMGDRLGISDSAVSERFRRGVKTLVERTGGSTSDVTT